MDKWIGKFVEKYNEMIFDHISLDVIRSFHYIRFGLLPEGFRRFVSSHLFYYEKVMTSKSLEDSFFDFILIYRKTPYKFKADFYNGFVSIFVLVPSSDLETFDDIIIGKYSISRFLLDFVSGQELEEVQSKENQFYDIDDDQFEIPF